MGNLARLLQHRFLEACPAGWECVPEERIMSRDLERRLGFAPRADVLLMRKDGSRRIWVEFEVSRADPVANHAKFAAAHLFEPRPASDAFVSMVSPHVARGRSNLAAAAVYLMRAVGMSAFQTSLLPGMNPEQVHEFNSRPLEALLANGGIDVVPEIDRAIAVSHEVALASPHRIHFAANLFEVMLNLRAWNVEVGTPVGAEAWGRRTVTFFVFDPGTGEFAPSKFCAFVPLRPGAPSEIPAVAMDVATYASLDESERRFDGGIARRHLVERLGMVEVPLADAGAALQTDFRAWLQRHSARLAVHRRGARILRPPGWW